MGTNQTVSRKMLVLVGPPGVGKKFCMLQLNGNHPMDIDIIKTVTTQPQRQIHDSLFYTTVSLEEFQQRVAAGQLLAHDEFVGHCYGVERTNAAAVLKQKHGVVSATPVAADALRRSGYSTVIAYLVPASKSLIETNLRQKHEDPERLTLMRQASTIFGRLPEVAYDIAVPVQSLVEAVKALEEKLRAYMELH
jgi:guanylate kinase